MQSVGQTPAQALEEQRHAQLADSAAVAESNGKPHHHIPALDGLRGLAVLLVFFYHYGGGAQSGNSVLRAIGIVNKAGWCGVTLFFVLSGFLITGILWDAFGSVHWLRNFYLRRVLRIFPLYYFVVLVVLVAGAWQHALGPSSRIALTLATFSQNFPYFQKHGAVPAPIFHLWSIAVEEQFYLLWPFLLLAVRRSRYAVLLPAGLFVASFLFRLGLWHYSSAPELYAQTLLVRGGELAAGATLALALRSPLASARRAMLSFAPFACLAFAAVFVFTSWLAGSFQLFAPIQWTWGLPAITLSFTALIATACSPGLTQKAAALAPLRFIGRISYGIYVFHFLLLHNVNQTAAAYAHSRQGSTYELSRFFIAAVATIAAALLSFYLLERPFLRYKRAFPMRPRIPASPLSR